MIIQWTQVSLFQGAQLFYNTRTTWNSIKSRPILENLNKVSGLKMSEVKLVSPVNRYNTI